MLFITRMFSGLVVLGADTAPVETANPLVKAVFKLTEEVAEEVVEVVEVVGGGV